jgi:predicted homoserine dehydrogenase-like protein
VVDFSTGRIAPGIFVIVYSSDPRIQKDMKFITYADGPYYLLFRPYHLCDLETPQSIAEAILMNEVTVTAETMHSEVAAVAKRDLRKDEVLGSIGSADFYGRIYCYSEAREKSAVPIGIAQGGRVRCDIRKGELLTETNVEPDRGSFVYGLRKEQDRWIEKA